MAKLTWDNIGERYFETGVDHAVLYPVSEGGKYGTGVAWSGITQVTESPSGAEATPFYADNIKYLNLMANEDFGFSISAYTYPDEFAECDGSSNLVEGITVHQQKRKQFGFSYRTRVGNDVTGDSYGYKLHLVYGCLASPSEKTRSTVNESPEATEFSWEVSTTPVEVEGMRPTAHIEIDSTKVDSEILKAIENKLYGDDTSGTPTLPTPSELKALVSSAGPS